MAAGRACRPAGDPAKVEQLAAAGPARNCGCCTCPPAKTPTTSSKEHGAGEYRACWSKAPLGWTGRSSRRWTGANEFWPDIRPSSSRPFRPWWHCWASCPERHWCAATTSSRWPNVCDALVRSAGAGPPRRETRGSCARQVKGERWAWRSARWEKPGRGKPARSGTRAETCYAALVYCTPPAHRGVAQVSGVRLRLRNIELLLSQRPSANQSLALPEAADQANGKRSRGGLGGRTARHMKPSTARRPRRSHSPDLDLAPAPRRSVLWSRSESEYLSLDRLTPLLSPRTQQ